MATKSPSIPPACLAVTTTATAVAVIEFRGPPRMKRVKCDRREEGGKLGHTITHVCMCVCVCVYVKIKIVR